MGSLDHMERYHSLMHCAYDVDTVRSLERPLLDEGAPLMMQAAQASADTILTTMHDEGWRKESTRICILVGGGDNGGDGLYTGAFLAAQGCNVTAIAVAPQLHEQAFDEFVHSGGHIWILDPSSTIPGCPSGFSAGEAGERLQTAIAYAKKSRIIIDAMAGIGIHGALRGIPATLANALGVRSGSINRPALPDEEMEIQTPLIVALDTPSGVGVDDGTLAGPYIPADMTIMFGAMKPCAMLPPAAFACGRITLVDFDFDFTDVLPAVESATASFARAALALPMIEDSKYSRGVTGLITGCDQYPGAAVLSTRAAARTNIGMVRYVGPERASTLVLQSLPEAVLGKGHVQSWVVGSGVSNNMKTQDIQHQAITALLQHYKLTTADQVLEEESDDERRHVHSPEAFSDDHYQLNDMDAPTALEDAVVHDEQAIDMPAIVVDAGALTMLPDHVPSHVVLTPHASELAELLTDIDMETSVQDVLDSPLEHATRAAMITGATVLLKGAITIVVGPDGEGNLRTIVSGRAPAFLATAGAGDVLAGITGALLAQHETEIHEDPAVVPEIVAAAAYLHGLSAAIASQSHQRGWSCPKLYGRNKRAHTDSAIGHPILASDVIEAISMAIDTMHI